MTFSSYPSVTRTHGCGVQEDVMLHALSAVSMPPTGFHPGRGEADVTLPDSPAWRWMVATLDEIDYGVVLLTHVDRALHVNHAARCELDAQHPLQLVRGRLCARAG